MTVLVIGEWCVDVFIYGDSKRLSPEAPVPIFVEKRTVTNSGMCGNVVNNLKALNDKLIVHSIRQTNRITKTRYIDDKSNHMFLRVDEGDNFVKPITTDCTQFMNYNAVIISDYNKGFLTDENICEIGLSSELSILDTKRILTEKIINSVTFIKVNEDEYNRNKVLIDQHLDKVIITLGKNGVSYKGERYSVNPRDTMDVSGAGDTFTASFTIKYLETKNIEDSISFANDMASLVVSKRGVSTP